MTEFKNKYAVYEIDNEDGALKFIYWLNTDNVIRIGDTLGRILSDETGKPIRRIYHKVQDIILPLKDISDHSVCDACEPVLHCINVVDEEITNIRS